jgi:hypothetical protein
MKKLNMLRVLVMTVSMTAFVLSQRPAHGQDVLGLQPAKEKADGPIVEHLKVEPSGIFYRLPGKAWTPGGPASVGNAVKALRELYPNDTFAVDPRVAELPLTDLVIRANEPTTDLWALRTACGGGFDIGGQPSLYTLQHNKSTEFTASKSGDRKIECFNLTGYLTRMTTPTAEEMTTPGEDTHKEKEKTDQAIAELQEIIKDTIADFDPAIGQPHFQFYAHAQLLIVTGSERAIEVAAKVINALPGQQDFKSNSFYGGDFNDQLRKIQESQVGKSAQGRTVTTYGAMPSHAPAPEATTSDKP